MRKDELVDAICKDPATFEETGKSHRTAGASGKSKRKAVAVQCQTVEPPPAKFQKMARPARKMARLELEKWRSSSSKQWRVADARKPAAQTPRGTEIQRENTPKSQQHFAE